MKQAGKPSGHVAPGTRRATILVVEDNDDHWFITRWALLRTIPGVQVVRTTNTLDTLSYLAACSYDRRSLPELILLDLYLPKREDGWALLEAVKLHHLFRCIPVVTLSSSAHPDDIEQSYYLRSASYMVKPTSYPEWLACFEDFRRYWMESVILPHLQPT